MFLTGWQILTTALFSVTMLGRALSSKRWIALVLLTFGVAIVQLPANDPNAYSALKDADSKFFFPRSSDELGQLIYGAGDVARELTKRGLESFSEGLTKRSATYEGIQEDMGMTKPVMNYSIGLTAVLVAALISGLTGVYFEKVLKESQTHVTVWTRNVQLSFYSLFPALIIGVIFKDGEEIAKNGFFDGYNAVVWTAIIFQATGGVLVAMCINYADNIAKNFATSISIILSFLFSVFFFDFQITFSVSCQQPTHVAPLIRYSLCLALPLLYLQHTSTAVLNGKEIGHLLSTSRVTKRQRSIMAIRQGKRRI
jgi:UDP-sugar transporter A1/2/3